MGYLRANAVPNCKYLINNAFIFRKASGGTNLDQKFCNSVYLGDSQRRGVWHYLGYEPWNRRGKCIKGKAQGVKSEQRAVKTVLSVKSLVLREDLSVNNHHISSVEILL